MKRYAFLIVGSVLFAVPAAAQWLSGFTGTAAHPVRAAAMGEQLTVDSSAAESPVSMSMPIAFAIEGDLDECDDAGAVVRSRRGSLIECGATEVTVRNDSRRARVVREQTCRNNP